MSSISMRFPRQLDIISRENDSARIELIWRGKSGGIKLDRWIGSTQNGPTSIKSCTLWLYNDAPKLAILFWLYGGGFEENKIRETKVLNEGCAQPWSQFATDSVAAQSPHPTDTNHSPSVTYCRGGILLGYHGQMQLMQNFAIRTYPCSYGIWIQIPLLDGQ